MTLNTDLNPIFYPFLFQFVSAGAMYVFPDSNQNLAVPCDPCFGDVTINPVFMEGKVASSFLGVRRIPTKRRKGLVTKVGETWAEFQTRRAPLVASRRDQCSTVL